MNSPDFVSLIVNCDHLPIHHLAMEYGVGNVVQFYYCYLPNNQLWKFDVVGFEDDLDVVNLLVLWKLMYLFLMSRCLVSDDRGVSVDFYKKLLK